MALRVLLGDESATIKKVIQLALQDYSVEVKSVHLGLDILDVARTFQPHIIFMDVLLQKKNGYQVCMELKADPELSSIPVVLMWSSFMSLDEDKFQECGAEVRLEKPFEVDDLREIIQRHVPIAQENPVAPFLKFSSTLTADFKEEAQKQAPLVPPPPKAQAAPPPEPPTPQPPPPQAEAPTEPAFSPEGSTSEKESWSMEDFDNLPELSTSLEPPGESSLFQPSQSDPWSAQSLDEFKVDLQESEEEEFVITTLDEAPETGAAMELTQIDEEYDRPSGVKSHQTADSLELTDDWNEIPPPPTQEAALLNPSVKKMVDEYLQRAFHSQLEARLEKALRELLPQVATRVIKEEIERLTRDLD